MGDVYRSVGATERSVAILSGSKKLRHTFIVSVNTAQLTDKADGCAGGREVETRSDDFRVYYQRRRYAV